MGLSGGARSDRLKTGSRDVRGAEGYRLGGRTKDRIDIRLIGRGE